MKVLAVANNGWGKADTIDGAKKKLREVIGRIPKDVALYIVPDDYHINEMGASEGTQETLTKAICISGRDRRE